MHPDATAPRRHRRLRRVRVAAIGAALGFAAFGASTAAAAPPAFTQAPTLFDNGPYVDANITGEYTGSFVGDGPFLADAGWARCDAAGEDCVEFDTRSGLLWPWSLMRPLSLNDIGHTIRYWIRATDANGLSTTRFSPASRVVRAMVPVPSPFGGQITLAGQATDRETLHGGFVGQWWGTAPLTFANSWERCNPSGLQCITIAGAHAADYQVQSADVGSTVRYAITATNAVGDATTIRTDPTALVDGFAPATTGIPTIGGSPRDGETLQATFTESWTGSAPIAVTASWERCNAAGADCTPLAHGSDSLRLTEDDVHHTIRYRLTASGPAGTATIVSAETDPIDGIAPTSTTPPALDGLAREGELLTAIPGAWIGSGPLEHRFAWQRCDATGSACEPLPSRDRQLRLTPALVGHTVRVDVTAIGSVGTATASSAPSTAIAARPPVSLAAPRALAAEGQLAPAPDGEPLTLAVLVGATLPVSGDEWDGTSDLSYAVQWERCTRTGTDCVAIEQAQERRFQPTAADLGRSVRAVITATNTAGHARAATDPVLVLANAPGAVPAISLTPTLLNVEQPRSRCVATLRQRIQAAGSLSVRGTLPGHARILSGGRPVLDLNADEQSVAIRTVDGRLLGVARGAGAVNWHVRTGDRVSVRSPRGRFLLVLGRHRAHTLVVKGRTCTYTSPRTARLAARADRSTRATAFITTDTGQPVAGARIVMSDGSRTTTAASDAHGRARLTLASADGARNIKLAFAGNRDHAAARLDLSLQVRSVASLTGTATASSVHLKGRVRGLARRVSVDYLDRSKRWRRLAAVAPDQQGRWQLMTATPISHAGGSQLVLRTRTHAAGTFTGRTSAERRVDIDRGTR